MKKILKLIAGALLLAGLFIGCTQPAGNDTPSDTPVIPPADKPSDTDDDQDKTFTYDEIVAGTTTALEGHDWYIANIDISKYGNKTVDINFSANMRVTNKGSSSVNMTWTVNDEGYSTIASKAFSAGEITDKTEWTAVAGKKEGINLPAYPILYLSSYGLTSEDLIIQIKDISVKITCEGSTEEFTELTVTEGITQKKGSGENSSSDDSGTLDKSTWLSNGVPSIYETYKDVFDSIGIAAEYGNFGLTCDGNKYTGNYTQAYWGTPSELYYEEVQNGIAKHANSITLGNELKPQFLLQWWSGSIGSSETLVDFTASNGQTIKVPSKLNGESLIYATLNVCKKMGVQMRGHVLTWHSQTPDGFFAKDYTPTYDGDLISNIVDKETMTARHEWYIKTVLKCVADWEAANNYKAIWAWDVVNEAMADDAGKTYTGDNQDWLRGSTAGTKDKSPNNGGGSRWYQIYGNEEFIINAFRFANAYAPADVKLCYNDYNEYMDYSAGWKTSAIEHIVNLIKAGEAQTINGKSVAPRFDVIAMQSHVGTNWPGVTGYENALKRFLALADVHVSEIDFSAATQDASTKAWGDYFTMLQKYGNGYTGSHKITNVTIWGINNENSWINPDSGTKKRVYPLLFNLVDNNTTTQRKDSAGNNICYDDNTTIPVYDIGDTYKPNDSFWAVINAHK